MKETGILLPVASLPSSMGIGDFGKTSYEFIDMLCENGITIWQIIPINPMGYGNSPYQSYSSLAGDEIYISLEGMWKEGLLDCEPIPFREKETQIDYKSVRKKKESYLKKAFCNFKETEEYRKFIKKDWVYTYGVYRTFKNAAEGLCWNQWPEWQKMWPEHRKGDLTAFEEEIRYQMFLQYVFYHQWMSVKAYASAHGVKIMGDVPFYVGVDSVDVWAGKDNFLLDAEGEPAFAAGVPPDYFSATGQRWGNPIYNWDYMERHYFDFWVNRLKYNSQLFDLVRIDHFRAFDTYWKIPASCPTAEEGEWIEAPGRQVLDAVFKTVPKDCLVAEDLGDLRPEVLVLKDHFGLKGMKVLQFTIDTGGKIARDTFRDKKNLTVYSGTHDNTTLQDWYRSQSKAAKRKIRRFLRRHGYSQGTVIRRLMQYTLGSSADYAILPMADIMELGADGRLNTPGTVGSPNWEWKLKDFSVASKKLSQLKIDLRREKSF